MTGTSKCAGCGRPPTTARPVPLCPMCLTEAAVQAVPDALRAVLNSLRAEAAADRPVPPMRSVKVAPGAVSNPSRPRVGVEEADRLMAERLDALKANGVQRVTVAQFRDISQVTGRSRPWVYLWLDKQAERGVMVKDASQSPVGYRFAA